MRGSDSLHPLCRRTFESKYEIEKEFERIEGVEVPAAVAQLVERVLGKDEVTGPTPVSSSEIDISSETTFAITSLLFSSSQNPEA